MALVLMAGSIFANISGDTASQGSQETLSAPRPEQKESAQPAPLPPVEDDLSQIMKRLQEAGLNPQPARYWKTLDE